MGNRPGTHRASALPYLSMVPTQPVSLARPQPSLGLSLCQGRCLVPGPGVTLEHAWPTRGYPTFWPLWVLSHSAALTAPPPIHQHPVCIQNFLWKAVSILSDVVASGNVTYHCLLWYIPNENINIKYSESAHNQKKPEGIYFSSPVGSYSHLYFSELKKLKIPAEEYIWNVTFINSVSSTSWHI